MALDLERKRVRDRLNYALNAEARRLASRLRYREKATLLCAQKRDRRRVDGVALRERERQRYAADPAGKLSSTSRWQEAHPEQVRAKARRWIAANPGKKHLQHCRRQVRRLGAKGSCSLSQLQARTDLYGGLCWVPGCGKAYEAIDHVIPLAKGGSNWPSNLRPICKHHNSSKGAKSPSEWLAAPPSPSKAPAGSSEGEAA